jgi:hypothetical protein
MIGVNGQPLLGDPGQGYQGHRDNMNSDWFNRDTSGSEAHDESTQWGESLHQEWVDVKLKPIYIQRSIFLCVAKLFGLSTYFPADSIEQRAARLAMLLIYGVITLAGFLFSNLIIELVQRQFPCALEYTLWIAGLVGTCIITVFFFIFRWHYLCRRCLLVLKPSCLLVFDSVPLHHPTEVILFDNATTVTACRMIDLLTFLRHAVVINTRGWRLELQCDSRCTMPQHCCRENNSLTLRHSLLTCSFTMKRWAAHLQVAVRNCQYSGSNRFNSFAPQRICLTRALVNGHDTFAAIYRVSHATAIAIIHRDSYCHHPSHLACCSSRSSTRQLNRRSSKSSLRDGASALTCSYLGGTEGTVQEDMVTGAG